MEFNSERYQIIKLINKPIFFKEFSSRQNRSTSKDILIIPIEGMILSKAVANLPQTTWYTTRKDTDIYISLHGIDKYLHK